MRIFYVNESYEAKTQMVEEVRQDQTRPDQTKFQFQPVSHVSHGFSLGVRLKLSYTKSRSLSLLFVGRCQVKMAVSKGMAR